MFNQHRQSVALFKGIQAMTNATFIESACPECDATIAFDRAPLNGQIAQCTDCGSELEVINTEPIQMELAPEVEEDWGE